VELVVFTGSRYLKGIAARQLVAAEVGILPLSAVVVTGGAGGADDLVHTCALSMGYATLEAKANWAVKGLPAGPIRNSLMAELATYGVAFWDGREKSGTMDCIKKFRKLDKPMKIIDVSHLVTK
jgi:hypothetical protein